MTVLIDPPIWPGYGTVWSHLVSDESLDELHGVAEVIGLPRRLFDEDHYDVPQRLYDTALASGAVAVTGRELIRRLMASGLRRTARDRESS
ncbi:DUF4031 domain-containing protein [Luteipulveratus mongoliensis]|uniref:DUF4031 domain-containing protein n=1 Tax=Luteipulveratus mongoliensis TaxID=571913 RepID=A0A0K1JKU9_9MICO|nr:DUF4031 domain-containing protein [Luteipulveratus mongoliensis]AKU17198.1 hypothetical protein VV02_17265 [Luteipulveratus mongoliensis]